MKLAEPHVKIIDYNRMLKNIERGGRLCYKSEDKMGEGTDEIFCEKLKSYKHFSVYEHASITVQVLTDRGVTHEVVRHRLAAFSQESTRYCNYSKDKYGNEITVLNPFFFDPTEECQTVMLPSTIHYPFNSGEGTLAEHPTELAGHRSAKLNSFDVWMITCLWAEWGYNTLTQVFKRSAQEARSVLPNSLKTEIQITMNAREWLHVFSCRVPKDAHPQMRQIMVPLAKEFAKKWPVIFGEYKDLVLPPKSSTIEWEV